MSRLIHISLTFAVVLTSSGCQTGSSDGEDIHANSAGTYVGDFKVGKAKGLSTAIDSNGTKYVGEFRDGKRHGKGTLEFSDGTKYVGEIRDDQLHGWGRLTHANGQQYVGEFKDNKKHGKGTLETSNGTKYVGDFRDDRLHGWGTLNNANGDQYVGEYRNNKRHGKGTYTHKNGDKFVGEYKDGKRHGRGTIFFVNGDKFVGDFKEGEMHGQGTSTDPGGIKFTGEFRNGMLNGYGTAILPNKIKYVGEFRNSKPHGRGIASTADGRVKEGIWENGKFKHSQKVEPIVVAKKRSTPKVAKRTKSIPRRKSDLSGSGFFVSKLGHIVASQHVVNECATLTVGDGANNQVVADVVETDKQNDLALLKISSIEMATAESKSLISKLGLRVVPLSSNGLLRSEDVELGEQLLVAGYPYGEIFSNTIKVTGGMVSAVRGIGDDAGQFQMDAAVQPGNSGGPIYDEKGNIVGVVISQLKRLKVAKTIGSLPELVNFGIKASTVRQFLTASGLPTKWSSRSNLMSTRELAEIARNQAVMVVCHR
jgi:hypothetical protein